MAAIALDRSDNQQKYAGRHMKTDSCPKCGSVERERGKVYEQGSLNDVRFKADAAPGLSLKKRVAAVACLECGYIEFYLSEHGTGNAA